MIAQQEAAAAFFAPISIAYLAICALIWLAFRWREPWPLPELRRSARPWLDAGLAVLAAVAVLGIGQLFTNGWLIPRAGGAWGHLTFNLNQLLIFSPLAVVLVARRQSTATVFVERRGLAMKLAAGVLLALVGTTIYLALRGELDRLGDVVGRAFTLHSLAHFLPVFLEAVAVAFLYVRLRWVVGAPVALLLPCLAFALGHLLSDLDRPVGHLVAFFALNTLLPLAIFAVVVRTRDVIWIGLPHYLLDVATGAFGR